MKKLFFAFALFLLAGFDMNDAWAQPVSFPTTGTTVPRELTDSEAEQLSLIVASCDRIQRGEKDRLSEGARLVWLNKCVAGEIRLAQERGKLPSGPLEIRFTEPPPANGGF